MNVGPLKNWQNFLLTNMSPDTSDRSINHSKYELCTLFGFFDYQDLIIKICMKADTFIILFNLCTFFYNILPIVSGCLWECSEIHIKHYP
jgi:hypothetical protein